MNKQSHLQEPRLPRRVIDIQYMVLEHAVTPTREEMYAIEQIEKTGGLIAIRVHRQLGSPSTRIGTVNCDGGDVQVIEWHDIPWSGHE